MFFFYTTILINHADIISATLVSCFVDKKTQSGKVRNRQWVSV